MAPFTAGVRGSSPRGRGKPPWVRLIPSRNGLIPARAGKTSTTRVEHFQHTAHPRAGGENAPSTAYPSHSPGSSPRGRGKRSCCCPFPRALRLIPARAGKTLTRLSSTSPRTAHPRAGGENPPSASAKVTTSGSSPRGRGKRFAASVRNRPAGLIPARAGKTVCRRRRRTSRAAHPRAGGENANRAKLMAPSMGSSPRGRGKRRRGPALRRQEGLIPARAGKTRDV